MKISKILNSSSLLKKLPPLTVAILLIVLGVSPSSTIVDALSEPLPQGLNSNCHIRGNANSLASAVITPIWHDGTTWKNANNVQVKITDTRADIANIVQTNNAGQQTGLKVTSGVFNQVPGCVPYRNAATFSYKYKPSSAGVSGTSTKSGLPYSGTNGWALSCDRGRHPGFNESFDVTVPADQTPTGARPGGTWQTKRIAPDNGSGVAINLVYTQPVLQRYQVTSQLVDGAAGQGYQDMPNAGDVTRYGAQTNIIVNNSNINSDNISSVSLIADNRWLSRVYAPDRIIVNGVVWQMTGSRKCNFYLSGDCRYSGGDYKSVLEMNKQVGGNFNGRPFREIPSGHAKNQTILVYWYYEPLPIN